MYSHKHLNWFLALTLLFTITTTGQEPASQPGTINPAMRADLERMIEISGSKKMIDQILTQVGQNLSQTLAEKFPGEPRVKQIFDKFLNRFRELMTQNIDEILEPSIQAYARHFTHDEIKQLIVFYETPLGKKILQNQSTILQESMLETRPIIQRIIVPAQRELEEDLKGLAKEKQNESSENPQPQ